MRGRDEDLDVNLAALVDHSLIVTDERDGEPVFAMLRTIRAFALSRVHAVSRQERT